MDRFLILLFFFFSSSLLAQEVSPKASWEKMIENGESKKALSQIQDFSQNLIDDEAYDSLPDYLVLYGRILQANNPSPQANQKLEKVYLDWERLSSTPAFRRRIAKSLANWYEYLGNTTLAYEQTLLALDWAKKDLNLSSEVLAGLYVNLGGLAVKNMDLPAAKKHLAQVLQIKPAENDAEHIYFANSYLGNIAYFTSNLDSAAYFYQKTLEAIDLLESNPRNQFYRKSIILNNLAGVQMAQSDFDAAEKSMNQTILFREKYMATDLDALEYQKVLQDYLSSLDNLAGLYKQMGKYSQAKQLLEYSYQRKSEELGEENLNTTKSQILLGQIYFDTQDLEVARKYLEEGLSRLQNSGQESAYWQGDGIHTLARMEDFLQNEDTADSLYRRAKVIFEEELQGEFDVIYLDFLKNFSLFLAENQKSEEAISLSQTARAYLAEINSDNLYLDLNQAVNQATIYQLGYQYQKSQQTISEAFALWNTLVSRRTTVRDSLQAVFQKPQLILIRNKNRYNLSNREPDLLKSIEKELLEGLEILDSQSDFLFEPSDISIQLDLNRQYFEFLEQVELDLYQRSGAEVHLDRLLAYHEHARYRQIRSRLQRNQQVRYGGIPEKILQREQILKERLTASLQKEANNLEEFTQANREWTAFLDTLRRTYPTYFQLHFESSESILKRVFAQLKPDRTYLRYLQVGQEWHVLVISGKNKKLIPLDTQPLSSLLQKLAVQSSDNKFQPALFHELYQLLWKPALAQLQTQRVVIIPEGLLFNLSFEALSQEPVFKWADLIAHSLLQKHSFSYQYGLLLLDQQSPNAYEEQLVAFAPGFFDQMKQSYQASFRDRQYVDKSYLELIPQPFTRRLVEEISARFESKVFLESGSTVANFKKEAGKSRILHLGTHAFSSNVNPSDSRLIFAKSSENPLEPHELFASEIYGLDLSSELAVLLACESGKPAYEPGEGMISLAHAFNYSGTQAMLIGLGKIDEKTSVRIAEDFYSFLEEGMPKDEALRKAKLTYLSQSQGRELAPSFWASLIILGNPEPVSLKPRSNILWIAGGLVALSLCLAWVFRKKNFSS
ncbi:MAG: CHAT domain-containing protein [Cyclobacteriaceae bacterium]|nr:CHAT domain-containing protein [Cyclobacteriaceae bacterium]MDX5465932.1 CHAT domain-containing protein [Cyclobacteriaceae bacterium]